MMKLEKGPQQAAQLLWLNQGQYLLPKKTHVFLSCTLQNRSKSEDKSVMYLTVHLYTLSNIRETNASLKKGSETEKERARLFTYSDGRWTDS